jgi:diphthamide biosynthesis protein 7
MSLIVEKTLTRHACTIEKFPKNENVDNNGTYFACGTYELDESSKERAGSIVVVKYNKEKLCVTSEVTTGSGVLDMKFCSNCLGAVLSDGSLDIFNFEHQDNDVQLQRTLSVNKEDEGLFLSLDFQDRFSDATVLSLGSKIAVSTQTGSVIVYRYNESSLDEDLHISTAHSLFGEAMPAWIVAFDPHDRHTLLSGGDDCKFRLWDMRASDTPTSLNKQHTAGVTSAQWHPTDSNRFVTGSYDEHLMVWDRRQLSRPLTDIHTGELIIVVLHNISCVKFLIRWWRVARQVVHRSLLIKQGAPNNRQHAGWFQSLSIGCQDKHHTHRE